MSRLFSITLWVLVILSLPALFLTAASSAFISPLAGILGALFALLYLVLVIWLLSRTPLWPDFVTFRRTPGGGKRRGEGSTTQWVAASLLWGAFVSFGLVMLFGLSVMDLTTKLGLDFFMASFTGAYPEEIAKSLGVALILLSFRQLNRPWHGLATGALVGLGFEVNENLIYGSTGALLDPNSDLDGMLMMWGYRMVLGPLIHTILSAFAGYGIALALFRAHKTVAWRWGVACAWIFLAFILHFIWNLMWDTEIASIINILVVSLVMYPLIVYLIWRSWHEASADRSYAYTPGVLTVPLVDTPSAARATADIEEPSSPEVGDDGSSR